MSTKTFNAKQGHCPVCNKTDLDYDDEAEFYGETYSFGFECENCGTCGREEYSSGEFLGFNIDYSEYFLGSESFRKNGSDDIDAQFVFNGEEIKKQRIIRKKKDLE